MKVKAILDIHNMPPAVKLNCFMVVRYCAPDTHGFASLWYYGQYDTRERAESVARQIGNGFVIEVEAVVNDNNVGTSSMYLKI